MTTQAVAASSMSHIEWRYQTFLSFRGEDEDLRHRFVGNLRHSLDQRGIRVFNDDGDDIRKGKHITEELMRAIKESQTAIIVFSKHYATSSFCLRELIQIQKCIKGPRRAIWVVFYDVDPSDVRHQTNSYETAFQKYDNNKIQYDEKEVSEWRRALTKAADVSGWHWEPSKCKLKIIGDPFGETSGSEAFMQGESSQHQQSTIVQLSSNETYEYMIREEIIQAVSKVVNVATILQATKHPVGLNTRVQDVEKLFEQEEPNVDGATMVGIWGIGGIGKSTLARAVYNKISKDYIHLCFLTDVGKKSIQDVAKTLLSETLFEKGDRFENVDESTISFIIKDRLQKKKVLLILDNIDNLRQLQTLAGEPNWFGCGSKIIITTRKKDLLLKHNVTRIYKVELLKPDEAGELLRFHAFGKDDADPKYEDIINRAIIYADGLPLVLEILGSHFGAHQSVQDWEAILDMYRRIPEKNVQKTLKVSYDDLEEIQQQIFLDIVCLYRRNNLEYVTHMLRSSHSFPYPEYYIKLLIDRSLIKIDEHNCLEMHDHIQEMGQHIVKDLKEPGKRSRLWSEEDIHHVLKTNTGTSNIQVIQLLGSCVKVNWMGKAFKQMTRLRQLIVGFTAEFSQGPQYLPDSLRVLKWEKYPLLTLPLDFDPTNLVILKLRYGSLETLKQPFMKFQNLVDLNLKCCKNLKEVPDIAEATNLEFLVVKYCTNLTRIHDSVGRMRKLRVLDALGCSNLITLIKGGIDLPSLENLNLRECLKLGKFPKIIGEMEKIKTLDLSYTAIEELPESIEKLVGLQCLKVSGCSRLRKVPICSILKLTKLIKFDAKECELFQKFKEPFLNSVSSKDLPITSLHLDRNNISDELLVKIIHCFHGLRVLHLCGNMFQVLPECIKNCHNLKRLSLSNCPELREISGIPPNLQDFSARDCFQLTSNSRELLLSQEQQGSGYTRFIVPGKEVPEWLHKKSEGDSMSFSFRGRYPKIALCVVFQVEEDRGRQWSFACKFQFDFLINGEYQFKSKLDDIQIQGDHLYLFDPMHPSQEFGLRSELLMEGWNHVSIKCHHEKWIHSGKDGFIKCIGVYAYDHKSCEADVDWDGQSSHEFYSSRQDIWDYSSLSFFEIYNINDDDDN